MRLAILSLRCVQFFGAADGNVSKQGPNFMVTTGLWSGQMDQGIGENKNLASQRPRRVADLRKILMAWRVHVPDRMPIPNPSCDPNRAAESWNIRSGKRIESDHRKRFPATEKDQ